MLLPSFGKKNGTDPNRFSIVLTYPGYPPSLIIYPQASSHFCPEMLRQPTTSLSPHIYPISHHHPPPSSSATQKTPKPELPQTPQPKARRGVTPPFLLQPQTPGAQSRQFRQQEQANFAGLVRNRFDPRFQASTVTWTTPGSSRWSSTPATTK